MILLSDILYFASIDATLHPIIQQVYEKDPVAFKAGSFLLFNTEQRNNLNAIVGLPLEAENNALQQSIDEVMDRVCMIMHERRSDESREFLHTKGITDEQIELYHIGDSLELEKNYNSVFYSLRDCDSVAIDLVQSCLRQYRESIVERYQNPIFLSYPSYRAGVFSGVVFRTLGFEKRTTQLRNMFKFYSPYNYNYLFNEDALEMFDEINVVEGVSDALALIRYGYQNTVSPSMVRLSPAHIRKLEGKKLNILFDRDMGGYAGAKYIIDRIPADQLKTVALTPNERDFDEEKESVIHSYMSNLSNFDIRTLV
jgi:DNA primase